VANTTKIKTVIDPYVRDWLSNRFPGHTFQEQLVPLTSGHSHKFDAVAEDRSIVGAILSSRPMTKGGKENTGGRRKALEDVALLKLLPYSVKKIMVFTDAGFRDLIHRRAARLGIESIDMMACELPMYLAQLRNEILDKASNEQLHSPL